MDKTELLEALEDGHNELIAMLEDLPDEALLEPGVEDSWSIKDILAHLTYWEGQTVTLLFQARQGVQKPTTIHFSDEAVDAINARWHEQSRERSLEIIWNDFVGVRKQTIRRVSEFSDHDLTEPGHFAWMNQVPLIELIANETVDHEEEHADAIRDWLDRRESRNNGAAHD